MKTKTSTKFIALILVLLVGILIVQSIINEKRNLSDDAVPQEIKDPRVEAIKNDESFKKMVELKAQKVVAEQDRKAERDRNVKALEEEDRINKENEKAIELRLENIRKEELEIASTSPFLQ